MEFVLGRSGVKTSSQLQTSLEGIIVSDWPSISLFGVILIELSPDRTTCACFRLTYFCFEFKSDLEVSNMKWSMSIIIDFSAYSDLSLSFGLDRDYAGLFDMVI